MTVKVVLSYVFDWVVLIVAAGIGAVLDRIEPNKRPFSLTDPNISYVLLKRTTNHQTSSQHRLSKGPSTNHSSVHH